MVLLYFDAHEERSSISFVFQIQSGSGDVTITNDGATILKQMSVVHPTAKMVSPTILRIPYLDAFHIDFLQFLAC